MEERTHTMEEIKANLDANRHDAYYRQSPGETYRQESFKQDTPHRIIDQQQETENLAYYLWLTSHLVTLSGTGLYWLHVMRLFPQKSIRIVAYKMTLLGCVITYNLVLYKMYRSTLRGLKVNIRNNKLNAILPLSELLQTENFHLLINTVLFMVTANRSQSLWKITPFAIYSFLNLANFVCYEQWNLNPIVHAFKPILNLVAEPLLRLSTFIDILNFYIIWNQDIGIRAQSGKNTSQYYILVIYFFNWLLRLEFYENNRMGFNKIINWIDCFIGEQLHAFICIVANPTNMADLDNPQEFIDMNKSIFFNFLIKINNVTTVFWFQYVRHSINVVLPLDQVAPKIKYKNKLIMDRSYEDRVIDRSDD